MLCCSGEHYRAIMALLFFLFLLKNIDCAYSLEPPHQGGSNEYRQSMFEQKYEKYQNFLSENFPKRVFIMELQ